MFTEEKKEKGEGNSGEGVRDCESILLVVLPSQRQIVQSFGP